MTPNKLRQDALLSHLTRMHCALSGRDMTSWKTLEAIVLHEIQSGAVTINSRILNRAIGGAGSISISRKAWQISQRDVQQAFLNTENPVISWAAVQNYTENDLTWLAEIGLANAMKEHLIRAAILRDTETFLPQISKLLNLSPEVVAINSLRAYLTAIPAQIHNAPHIIKAIRLLLDELKNPQNAKQAKYSLEQLMDQAISYKDLRLLSLLLTCGHKFEQRDPANAVNSLSSIIQLINQTCSNHGRIALLSQEPCPLSILMRPAEASFHGIERKNIDL